MYISAPHVCLVPAETRRRHWIARNWSYRWFWATAWELGIEPGASERVSSTHNYWASLQPQSACKFKSTDLLFCFSWGGSTSHPVPSFPHSKPVCTHFWWVLSLLPTDKRGSSYLKVFFLKKKMHCSAPKMNITRAHTLVCRTDKEYAASTWKCKHMKALRWENRCSMWGNLTATPTVPSPAECCCVSEKACVREQGHQDYPKWY